MTLFGHYHWMIAQVFAAWVVLLSLFIFSNSRTVWLKIIIAVYLVYISFYSIPQSVGVILGGLIAYPIVRWATNRQLFPNLESISSEKLLIGTCLLSITQPILVIISDPGQFAYLLRENSIYFLQIIGIYFGIHAVALFIETLIKVKWIVVILISLLLLFLINAYVITPLLLSFIFGYIVSKYIPEFSVSRASYILIFLLNGLLICFYYSFMSFFTIRGMGPYYNQSDAVLNLATLLSPFLLAHGVLSRRVASD